MGTVRVVMVVMMIWVDGQTVAEAQVCGCCCRRRGLVTFDARKLIMMMYHWIVLLLVMMLLVLLVMMMIVMIMVMTLVVVMVVVVVMLRHRSIHASNQWTGHLVLKVVMMMAEQIQINWPIAAVLKSFRKWIEFNL